LEKNKETPPQQLTIDRVSMEIIDANCQPDINCFEN
jgi:hypothetical protein